MGRNRTKYNNCDTCDDCVYMCGGDFACSRYSLRYNNPVYVKKDWIPTEYFNNCKKCKGEEI